MKFWGRFGGADKPVGRGSKEREGRNETENQQSVGEKIYTEAR